MTSNYSFFGGMTLGKTIDHYHSLISEAWTLTKSKRELVLFGVFASLLSIGITLRGVINASLSLRPVSSIQETIAYLASQEFGMFKPVLNWLEAGGSERFILLALLLLVTITTGLFVGGMGIQSLIYGISATGTKRPTLYALFERVEWITSFHLVVIHVARRVLTALVVGIGILGISFFLEAIPSSDILLFIAFFGLTLPFVFAFQTIAMIASFHTVKHRLGVIRAVAEGMQVFSANWIVLLEYAVFLFIVNAIFFLLSFGTYVIGLSFVAILSTLISGISPILASLFAGFFTILGIFSLLVILGLVTVFNYSTWSLLLKRIENGWVASAAHLVLRTIYRS